MLAFSEKNCHMHFEFLVEIVSGNQMTIFDFYELRGGGVPFGQKGRSENIGLQV